MNITPNKGGEQSGGTPPPTSPTPAVVLTVAAACGTVSGYLTGDWKLGVDVFMLIVALFTQITPG